MRTLDQIADWNLFTDDTEPRSMPLTARKGDVYYVGHHAFNRLIQDTLALSMPGGKTVTSSFPIGPVAIGGDPKVVGNVPWNGSRPFTTASWVDDQAITSEISNEALTPPYPVAGDAKYHVAEIIAAMHVELGMPLDRYRVTTHQEVYARGWGSYATACPGQDLQTAMDGIVEVARKIVTGANEPVAPIEWEDHMRYQIFRRVDPASGKNYDGEYMLACIDMSFADGHEPGAETRPDNVDAVQNGYRALTNWDEVSRLKQIFHPETDIIDLRGGEPIAGKPQGDYIRMQRLCRTWADEYSRVFDRRLERAGI
jgi:hypothetical protein